MDGANSTATSATWESAIETGITFLQALFDESDTILFRPIETWSENGKKRSRVDYRNTCYRSPVPALLEIALSDLLELSEKEQVNLFFGVCPRFGGKGRFDLVWQIRTVRALWTDIDHITIEESQKRVVQAGLPSPSIIVNSGNGVHLYWLLGEPFLIDDAGDPPAVETEWVQLPGGRKQPRKYFVENGDRVYLDQRRHVNRLSPRAQHIQDVMTGIAEVLGGDNTKDVSRLLRIPGSLNRKNERNGQEPKATALVECHPALRYSLSTFEPLAKPAPDTERAKKIAAMPLPRPRRSIAPAKADKLAELIAASGIAEAGTRSEPDFAVCCFAIRNGITKEEVWSQVASVGKFAEQGQRYFDHTWANAEYEARATMFEKLQTRAVPKDRQIPVTGEAVNSDPGGAALSDGDELDSRGRPIIVVDAVTTPVADTLSQVTDKLLTAGNCFNRTEQLVVINDQQIRPILSSPELAGLLNQHVEFYFVKDETGEYKPLPPAYANTWLNHHVEKARLPVIKLFTRNPVFTDDWRLVGPGHDAASGIYYAGPTVAAHSGTDHLDALLQDFCFKKPADRTNYLGLLLTALLVPRFIGSKPAALFNGNQPELGKSILAQIVAILRDGQPAETVSYNPNDGEFEKRLGAIVRGGGTTIIVDNAKTPGRNACIESACLERSITDPILSFRLLGQSASIRAENSHMFCITANCSDVSRDLVTRCVVVNLYFEGDPQRRTFTIDDPEAYAHAHRAELLGELIGMVERWKTSGMPLAKVQSRFNKKNWGNIVGGILEACGEPDFLANADEMAAALDETRRDFAELVGVLAEHPQGTWTASELVKLCGKHGLMRTDLGEGSPRSLATRMGTLAGRFIGERFPLPDGQEATFHRTDSRKGNVYKVFVEKVPNLEEFAEPMPNLAKVAGSAL